MPHCPLERHTCTALPEHCVVPAMQAETVVHAPLTQLCPLGHALVIPHWPLEPHTCTALPKHCVVPGMQRGTISIPEMRLLFTTDVNLMTYAPLLLAASLNWAI